jgi:MFS family permease
MAKSTTETRKSSKQFLAILSLIIAGEAIFILPFVLVRVFRPTVLEVFGINNLELGLAFSGYGIIAMISYFLGGPLADKYSAKNLITIALATTGIGGLFLSSIPELPELKILYGFWGATTILLFWAALIRATREWGGSTMQGTAFGLLDGGRGLTAALISSIAVAIFAFFLPGDVEVSSLEQKTNAYRNVVLFVSAFIFIVSILVYFVLPKGKLKKETPSNQFLTKGLVKIIRMPVIWLQAIIIVSAYVGYKTTDDFSLFAKEVLYFDEVDAASIGTIALWMRFIVAILAGLIADRISVSRMTIISFSFMLIGGIFFSSGIIKAGLFWLFFMNIVSISIGIYALRGLYFAIMQEGKVPLIYTGTAVGLMSVIGYTPDIFMGPLMGYLLDSNPGPLGHQYVFVVLVIFSLIGLFSSIWYRKLTKATA